MQKSCIYKGTIGHQRRGHAANTFRYSQFMLFLDLAELDTVFDRFWLWSTKRPALARFRRSDHCGNSNEPLRDSIAELIATRTGRPAPTGPIRLLTHLSYFGYCFNPLSVYYCYDKNEQLQDVVLEVSNIPWGEQHCYVLATENNLSKEHHHFRFNKNFYVSPFMPMDMEYACRLTPPGEHLFVSLDNYRDGARVFGSQLAMDRHEINSANLAKALATDPFMTLRVSSLIHWQALKLWLKRARYYKHPDNRTQTTKTELSKQGTST
jgi:uncharacterized protein